MALRNLITDIPGVRVGHAADAKLGSGTTAVIFDAAVVASVDVRGGGPGTRETALLDPAQTVERHRRHRVVRRLGLWARRRLRRAGVAARAGPRLRHPRRRVVPIVPAAILFDLLNGGDKNWGRYPPYRELGYEAAQTAAPNSRSAASARGWAPPPSTSRAASARLRR